MTTKEAKELCGYQAKPVHKTCSNCASFTSVMVLPAWMLKSLNDDGEIRIYDNGARKYCSEEEVPEAYKIEGKMRCTDHGFATKKTATCNMWRAK